MSFIRQNLRLFHVSNLSVLNFRFFPAHVTVASDDNCGVGQNVINTDSIAASGHLCFRSSAEITAAGGWLALRERWRSTADGNSLAFLSGGRESVCLSQTYAYALPLLSHRRQCPLMYVCTMFYWAWFVFSIILSLALDCTNYEKYGHSYT